MNSTSTTALLKGNEVRTSPRVMVPLSMVARMPPAFTRAKDGGLALELVLERRYSRIALVEEGGELVLW